MSNNINIVGRPLNIFIHADKRMDKKLITKQPIIKTINMLRNSFNELEFSLLPKFLKDDPNQYPFRSKNTSHIDIPVKDRIYNLNLDHPFNLLIDTYDKHGVSHLVQAKQKHVQKIEDLFKYTNTFIFSGGKAFLCLNQFFTKILEYRMKKGLQLTPLHFHFNCEGIYDDSTILSYMNFSSNANKMKTILFKIHTTNDDYNEKRLSKYNANIFVFNNPDSLKRFSVRTGWQISSGNKFKAPIFIYYWLRVSNMNRYFKNHQPQ